MVQGNGFTEFNNDRGQVERLLVPFRALADTLQASRGANLQPLGYSRFDLFGYHPKQHEGFQEALWEAWRMWQLEGYPPVAGAPFDRFLGYKHGVQNIADSVGRGMETWTRASDDARATVTFSSSLGGYFTNLDVGVPRADGGFLTAEAYQDAVTSLFEEIANDAFPASGKPRPFWPTRFWHHLFYAFAIEATNALAIYRKLIHTAGRGEELGFLTEPSHRWMRATESVVRLNRGTSDIVNDGGAAARRNAYYRLFGLDLDKMLGSGVPYDKSEVANLSFVRVFEDLLYEVWNAYTNTMNTSGPNTTDPVAIVEICRTLRDMLNDRRLYGTMTRVEYAAVMEMSWHYLVIDGIGNTPNSNSPIIADMRCQATTPDERLRRLGEAVGVPAHPKTRALLKLAERVSLLLIEIECGTYDAASRVKELYTPGQTCDDMLEIINEWSILVGRDVKAARTAPQGQLPAAEPTGLLGR